MQTVRTCFCFVILLFCASEATTAPVTFEYACGTSTVVSYTFADDIVDSNTTSSSIGSYSLATPITANATVGGTTYNSPTSGTITVHDNFAMEDEYLVNLDFASGGTTIQVSITLTDSTQAAFSSDALPATRPVVSSFATTQEIKVTTLASEFPPQPVTCSITAVPEPSAWSYSLLVASCLGFWRRISTFGFWG